MAAGVGQLSTPSGESGSYVQSLLEPAVEGTTVRSDQVAQPGEGTEQATVEGAGETTPPKPEGEQAEAGEQTKPPGLRPEVEALIQEYAKEHGVDPNDPDQRRHLKRLADKEFFIRSLQTKLEELKGQLQTGSEKGKPGAREEVEHLTAFERTLLAPEGTGEAGAQGEAGQPAATKPGAASPKGIGDIGDSWTSPRDACKAEADAWAEGDFDKVHDVQTAVFFRRFLGIGVPAIEKIIAAKLQEFGLRELGDVRSAVRERKQAGNREFAIAELGKVAEFKAVIPMLFEATEGPPVAFDGKNFPNNPLNRILAEHPEIMDIRAEDADPDTAERLTYIKQYRAAARILKRQQGAIEPGKAKELVEAGAKMHQREQEDRARQGINAGPGATGLGGKSAQSYVEGLNKLPGEVSFSELLKH